MWLHLNGWYVSLNSTLKKLRKAFIAQSYGLCPTITCIIHNFEDAVVFRHCTATYEWVVMLHSFHVPSLWKWSTVNPDRLLLVVPAMCSTSYAVFLGLVCSALTRGTLAQQPRDLHLLGLMPFGGSRWQAGRAMMLAINMALEQINNRTDVLDGYRLHLIWKDTRVSQIPVRLKGHRGEAGST